MNRLKARALTAIAAMLLYRAEELYPPTPLKFYAEACQKLKPPERTWLEFIPHRLGSEARMESGRKIGNWLLERIANQRGDIAVTVEERGG